ncbi:MAG: GNAT family N-acetyltransferase [Acidimicrobiales bacterium]|nr:GNAT family N-acetyltransferase [Acidimicrobiales bacterium]
MDRRALQALDSVAASATVSPVDELVEGWRCKAAPDLPFRRCNVVLAPVGIGDDPEVVQRGLDAVQRWCADRGQRLIVQVSDADPTSSALDRHLAAAGLSIEAPVDVMVAPIGAVRAIDARDRRHPTAEVEIGIDEAWAASAAVVEASSDVDRVRALAYGRMLAELGPRAMGATVEDAGRAAGLGFGVVDGPWLGIFGMRTAPNHRRRGVASAIVTALCHQAAAAGATDAYLQVEVDNDAAIACYRRLGFVRSHGYHYRSNHVDPEQGC